MELKFLVKLYSLMGSLVRPTVIGFVLQIVRNIQNYKGDSAFKIVTIGNFDGLHIGHKSIFSKLISESSHHCGESILITFSPHPAQVLVKDYRVELIQTESQFIEILKEEKLSTLVIEEFTKDYSKLTAEQFFDRIYNKLKFNKLLIGYDFKFGKDKLGNFDFLHKKSIEHNFELEKIKPFKGNNLIVSSTHIRNFLRQGEVKKANSLLGRSYTVEGTVIRGEGKGAQIGFPTLNLQCENDLFLKHGVYHTGIMLDGKKYNSITNFGRAPTIKNETIPVLETHVMNEDLNCYGESVKIEFLKFIRPERKFTGVDELVEQIKKDISFIRE